MPLRRRGSPPYEIMSSTGAPGSHAPAPAPGSSAPGSSESAESGADGSGYAANQWNQWMAEARHPLVLRLPRGYAVLATVGFVVLLVLAYWTGSSRGYQQGVAAARPGDGEPIAAGGEHARVLGDRARSVNGAGSGASGQKGSAAAPGGEPRRIGLNYFILAIYPEAEAKRLVDFLRASGVEAMADPIDNKRFHVIALRGFTAEELRGDAREAYEQRLRQLGRQWKAQHRGTDLADMYPAKFRG